MVVKWDENCFFSPLCNVIASFINQPNSLEETIEKKIRLGCVWCGLFCLEKTGSPQIASLPNQRDNPCANLPKMLDRRRISYSVEKSSLLGEHHSILQLFIFATPPIRRYSNFVLKCVNFLKVGDSVRTIRILTQLL